MRFKILFLLILFTLFFFIHRLSTSSQKSLNRQIPIHADPQYLIINESELLKDKIDWTASDAKWQKDIKPKVKAQLEDIRKSLGKGTKDRKLGFSIIVQYMDYPLDIPSENSPYVVMTRRLMEVSEEMNFPVFIPLNGFQWWNQLPELWNWWDSGPDQIEGCQKDKYPTTINDPQGNPEFRCKFPELRDPKFRERFVKGYNPENRWNVEWVNWNTPMKENWRNWGGGPFQIAPIPNLVDHKRTKLSFRSVQRERLEVIYDEIYKKLKGWNEKNKSDLFAGVSIGTEVSLHTAALSTDRFEIFGYRGLQDLFCEKDDPFCAEHADWSPQKIRRGREEIIYRYLNDLGKMTYEKGIPKQRIYTHVWGENIPPDKQYVDYFISAVNLYTRPGLSLYGYADKPFELLSFQEDLKKSGNPAWSVPEFNIPKEGEWEGALEKSFDNDTARAKLIDIYNWKGIKDTEAVPIVQTFLKQEVSRPVCQISEIQSTGENSDDLRWDYLTPDDDAQTTEVVILKNKQSDRKNETKISVPNDAKNFNLKSIALKAGNYFWFIKRTGCGKTVWTTSAPQILQIGNWWERMLSG